MTQPIEATNIRPRDILSSGSRYIDQNVIYYGEQKFVTFDLYLRKEYDVIGDEDVMVITKGFEYRPDLVSYDYYGYTDDWWKILEFNKMKDIFEFKTGVTISLPSLMTI